jgi:hypothetical protein
VEFSYDVLWLDQRSEYKLPHQSDMKWQFINASESVTE